MIKKFLFLFFFFLGISIISILFLPTLLMPTKIVLFGGKLMGKWSSICLKIFLQTNIIIKGRENIIKDQKFLLLVHINQCLRHFIYKQFLIHQYLF